MNHSKSLLTRTSLLYPGKKLMKVVLILGSRRNHLLRNQRLAKNHANIPISLPHLQDHLSSHQHLLSLLQNQKKDNLKTPPLTIPLITKRHLLKFKKLHSTLNSSMFKLIRISAKSTSRWRNCFRNPQASVSWVLSQSWDLGPIST